MAATNERHSIHCAGYRGVGREFDERACDCLKQSVSAEIVIALTGLPEANFSARCSAVRVVLQRFGIPTLSRPVKRGSHDTD